MTAASEMAERIAAYDWAATDLGPRSAWPEALSVLVETILNTAFPMLVWWGPDLVQIYNDAYIALLGARHPSGLGQTAGGCWPEVWDRIGPMIAEVIETGEPFWAQDMEFTLERNGFPEHAFFTFSYSRIGDRLPHGGVLCTNVETTTSVMREREFRAMADNIAHIVFTQRANGSIDWVNSRWREFTRLPHEPRLNRGWADVIEPDDLRRLNAEIARAIGSGEPYEAEVRFKPFDGGPDSYRWHLVRAVPMRALDGSVERWAGSATDVHDQRLAERALRDRLERDLRREHDASVAFQRAALPQSLPLVPGLWFDAIYEAAGEDALVGGDWYDAFRLPDGRVVISVGDVNGKGLQAAVTMAGVRQAIRGAAHVYPEPAAVLDAADRALRSEQPDRIVTAFVGVLDPLTLTLAFANAGHPAPLVRCADGAILELGAAGLPLGLRSEGLASLPQASIVLPEDALLVLYTDGLTEATRDVLEGEQRLRAALERDDVYRSGAPAAAVRRSVVERAFDDVAILTIRVARETGGVTRWSFGSHDEVTASRVRHALADTLRRAGASESEAADAELVFGELLGNVVRHTPGDVEAALDLTSDAPVLHVLDRGPGFTFYARLPKDSLSESGRGLYIATMLARDVSVVPRTEGGSHARVVLAARNLRQAPPAALSD